MFAGLFHAALSLAVVLYQGQRLSQALQRSVAAMVTFCVQKQLQDSSSDRVTLPAAGMVFGQQLASPGRHTLSPVFYAVHIQRMNHAAC